MEINTGALRGKSLNRPAYVKNNKITNSTLITNPVVDKLDKKGQRPFLFNGIQMNSSLVFSYFL
ncbi:MAG: hypothetical protein HQK91_12050 [Nitrospirae bacterium]|nr:hypothetical protein [Nitrospirota bacterium]